MSKAINHSVASALKFVGGTVKLSGMTATQYNNTWMHCYGVELGSDGSTKLKLRVHSAEGVRTYDGKYVKVHIDKVVAFRPHALKDTLLTDEFTLRYIYDTGLDPITIVAPEFIVDKELCDGFQAWNVGYHARKYGLEPLSGYILSCKHDGGFLCYYHVAFTKDDAIYVPIGTACTANAYDPHSGRGGAKCFFLPDPALGPRVEEKMKLILPMFFSDQTDQISSMVLVAPFRNMGLGVSSDRAQPQLLKAWQNTQYLPMTKSWQSNEFAHSYTDMQESVCVVDRPMALAVDALEVSLMSDRPGPVHEPVFLRHVSMTTSRDILTHPGVLARSCVHCKCIALGWVECAHPTTGEAAAYCSQYCHKVHAHGGAPAVEYSARAPEGLPHWRVLDAMPTLTVELATRLRGAMYRDRADVMFIEDGDREAFLDDQAKSPLPMMVSDPGSGDVDPTHIVLAMTDEEFANFPSTFGGEMVVAKLAAMRARDTRSMAERKARAEEESKKAIKWSMPDGTFETEEFAEAYGKRLMDKIEAALGWKTGTPFDDAATPPPPPPTIAVEPNATRRDNRHVMLKEQEAARDRARAEYAALVAKHDERERLAAAERRLAELERRRKVAASRIDAAAAKQAAEARRIAAAAPTPPRSSKKKARVKDRRAAEEAVAAIHAVHVNTEQKAYRSRDFDARQELAHIEAEMRKAQALVDKERAIIAAKGKAEAERGHFVPAPPTVGGVLVNALA